MIFVLLTGLLLPDDRSHGDHDNGTTEAANSSASGSATVPAGHAPVHSQPGPRRGAFVAWHDDGSFGSRHGRCRRGREARDEDTEITDLSLSKKIQV